MLDFSYGKLIENEVEFVRLPLILQRDLVIDGENFSSGEQLFTNSSEVIRGFGFKKIIFNEMPKDKESYTFRSIWKETDTEIVQTWIEEKLPDNPYEIIDTLTGEV